MSTLRQSQAGGFPAIGIGVGLAFVAAVIYVLIAVKILTIGDVKFDEGLPTIIFTAAACYTVGGLLILARRRWLWILGAVINAFVMLFFYSMYQDRLVVIFSPGGMASKSAQLLLEVVLVYLIISDLIRARRPMV